MCFYQTKPKPRASLITEIMQNKRNSLVKLFTKVLFNYSYLLFVSAYLAPILYTYFATEYFIYENGWDESYYLSYQGAVSLLKTPGYFLSAWIVFLLHRMGFSGAYQNLLFDLLTPALIFLLACMSLQEFKVKPPRSRAYSIIIVFGCVLFNVANPIFKWIALRSISFEDSSFIVAALEHYPSLLRTPNPQVSYILIACIIYLFSKYRKIFILLLPLPLLYWSVAIPYAFLTTVFWGFSRFNPSKYYQLVLINLFSLFFWGVSLSLMLRVTLSAKPALAESRLSASFDSLLVSPLLIWSILAYLLAWASLKLKGSQMSFFTHFAYLSFVSSLFFITNLQIFTRTILDPKGLQDSSGTFIASFVLILTIHVLSQQLSFLKEILLRRILLLAILLLLLSSQNFSFKTMQYTIYLGYRMDDEDINRVKHNSLAAIIPYLEDASKITLLAPEILAPPFAYHYGFPAFNSLCSLNQEWMSDAYDYVQDLTKQSQLPDYFVDSVEERYDFYLNEKEVFEIVGYQDNYLVCSRETHLGQDFDLVEFTEDSPWALFPNWSILKSF